MKIKFEDRNVIAYLSAEEINSIDYQTVINKVRQVARTRLRNTDLKVEYVDDENTLVELHSDGMSLQENVSKCNACGKCGFQANNSQGFSVKFTDDRPNLY